MSKLLTVIALLFLLGFTSFGDLDAHGRTVLALYALATIVVLGGLWATRRDIPVDQRRGVHRGTELPGPITMIAALPWMLLSLVGLVASFIIGLLTDFDRLPRFNPWRIARHAWRIWLVAIGIFAAMGIASDELGGDAPVTAATGLALLAGVRLLTRWMDRVDAATAGASPVDPTAPTSLAPVTSPVAISSDDRHRGPFL